MHPLSSLEAPAQIIGACDSIATIGYILARGYEGPFGQFFAKAEERGWWREELACGHDVMLDMPNELTALLLQGQQQRRADTGSTDGDLIVAAGV
jgi:hypothetical protein